MPQFFHSAGGTVQITPAAELAAGSVFVATGYVPPIACINPTRIPKNVLGAGRYRGGVWAIDKGTAAFAVGDLVYWDAANAVAVHLGTTNLDAPLLGVCVAAAASNVNSVLVDRDMPANPHMLYRPREVVSIASTSKTLDAEDTGKLLVVDGSATNVVALPATAIGIDIVIVASATGSRIAISPTANDRIFGADFTGADNKDRILASARAGDFIRLVSDGAHGWLVLVASGIWTTEA